MVLGVVAREEGRGEPLRLRTAMPRQPGPVRPLCMASCIKRQMQLSFGASKPFLAMYIV